MYFIYHDNEIEYLKKKDKKLAYAIETIGKIDRAVIDDVFSALINSIIGQQISTVAHKTIWERLKAKLKNNVNPQAILALSDDDLQSIGISYRKVDYIKSVSEKVLDKSFDIENLVNLSDDEVIKELSALNGIGVWTAEMIMIFSMQRRNILSYGDLAILKGMRMLYGHKEITKELFAKYHKRYSPYASVASLYFWAIAGNAMPELIDKGAVKKKNTNTKKLA